MKLRHLYMQNFRAIVSQDFDFDPVVTVLSGRNGGGKSTVLEAIATMLSWIPAKISTIDGIGRQIEVDDITYGKNFSRLSLDISPENGKGEDIRLTLYKKRPDAPCHGRCDTRSADRYGKNMKIMMESDGNSARVELPVLAYYGANRDKFGYASPAPDSEGLRTSIYKNAFEAAADFQKFGLWAASVISAVEKERETAEALPRKQRDSALAEVEKKARRMKIVKNALARFSPNFSSFSSVDGKLFVDSKKVFADRLSDGEKTAVALISDIAMRMIVANPEMPDPLRSNAVILIDELDLHLHPEWQAQISRRLPDIFPNAQFIISSHSPSVMGSAHSLYSVASSDEPLAPTHFDKIDSPYGREPADILKDLLNARRPKEIAEKIKNMYSAIDSGDLKRAEAAINELMVKIPDDPEVMRGEYLIRALLPK